MNLNFNRRKVIAAIGSACVAFSTMAASQAQEKTFKLSHHIAPGHLVDVASHKFASLVAEYTDGAIKVDVFPSGQIAGLRQGAEAVQLGTVDFVWSDMGTLGNWRPELGFVSLPFLFADDDHFEAFFNGDGGKALAKELNGKLGIEVLGFGNAGFRVVATRDKPIHTSADMKDLRIRVPEIPVYVQAFESVDTNPTPMAWGEVYTALQTGVIDAVENPAEGLVNGSMQEVTGHLSRTFHIMTDINLFANAAQMEGLPAEHADAIRRAAAEAVTEFNKKTRDNAQKNWDILTKTMKAVENPDRAAFEAAMAPVWDEFLSRSGDAGKAWIDLVKAAK